MTVAEQNEMTAGVELISGYNGEIQCFISLIHDVLNTANSNWTVEKISCLGALAHGMERLTADIEKKCESLFAYAMHSYKRRKK